MKRERSYIQSAQQLLYKIKSGYAVSDILEQLANGTLSDLKEELNTEEKKKVFWINVYNAFFQFLRKIKGLERPNIFRDRHIKITNSFFSLDDIEHGILRKYRYKKSLGFLPNIFVPKKIRQLAMEKIDYRIHFALNCGAKSCPPIAFYNVGQSDQQLDWATVSFLESETEIDHEKRIIRVTQLFKWYLADFGGVNGIRKVVERYLKMNTKGYKVLFLPYSWEEHLDNYKM